MAPGKQHQFMVVENLMKKYKMGFTYDFSTGNVVCDECNESIKTHVDFLINGMKGDSIMLINKECFKNAKKFLRKGYARGIIDSTSNLLPFS